MSIQGNGAPVGRPPAVRRACHADRQSTFETHLYRELAAIPIEFERFGDPGRSGSNCLDDESVPVPVRVSGASSSTRGRHCREGRGGQALGRDHTSRSQPAARLGAGGCWRHAAICRGADVDRGESRQREQFRRGEDGRAQGPLGRDSRRPDRTDSTAEVGDGSLCRALTTASGHQERRDLRLDRSKEAVGRRTPSCYSLPD